MQETIDYHSLLLRARKDYTSRKAELRDILVKEEADQWNQNDIYYASMLLTHQLNRIDKLLIRLDSGEELSKSDEDWICSL